MKITFLSALVTIPIVVNGALDAKMKAKGREYIGTALDAGHINDNTLRTIFTTEFGSLTHENSMKWDATEPSRGSFNFGNADRVVNFATENQKQIRGHTLVWHSQLPGWVNSVGDANSLRSVMTNHINTLMRRYNGKIHHWDVVNEAFEENGTFRNSVFYRVLGEQFIDHAFTTARAADPVPKLYINDYNLDGPGAKIDGLLALVGRMRGRGTPIDGIGTQAHLILGQVGSVQTQLQRLADTGLEVAITELDIRIARPVNQQKLQQQQGDFNTVFKACLAVPKCVGVTVWGISDRNSWVDTTFPSYDAPLLYDDNLQRKAAYTGADQALT